MTKFTTDTASTNSVRPFVGAAYPDRLTVYQELGEAHRDIEAAGGSFDAVTGEVIFPDGVDRHNALVLLARLVVAVDEKRSAERMLGRLN